MNFLREYATNIIVISVLAILFEIILPQTSHKKYINVVIGLVVMMVIISPLTKLPGYKETFTIPTIELDGYSNNDTQTESLIAKEFAKKLALKINEGVYAQFGKVIKTKVTVDTDQSGVMVGIKSIHISDNSEPIIAYISQTFGIGKEKIIGGE